MTTLQRLQEWYACQCDGDWEHQHGVSISTLDNPGWSVDIDITETALAQRPFAAVRTERSEHDWFHAWIDGPNFLIRCGPKNLDEALRLFLDWAEVA